MRASEIRVKRIRVNQGLGVYTCDLTRSFILMKLELYIFKFCKFPQIDCVFCWKSKTVNVPPKIISAHYES